MNSNLNPFATASGIRQSRTTVAAAISRTIAHGIFAISPVEAVIRITQCYTPKSGASAFQAPSLVKTSSSFAHGSTRWLGPFSFALA